MFAWLTLQAASVIQESQKSISMQEESEINHNSRDKVYKPIFYEDVTRGLSLVLTILPKGPYSCKAFKTKAYLSSWGKSLSCNAAANIMYMYVHDVTSINIPSLSSLIANIVIR